MLKQKLIAIFPKQLARKRVNEISEMIEDCMWANSNKSYTTIIGISLSLVRGVASSLRSKENE